MNLNTIQKKREHYKYLISRLEKIQLYGDDAISNYDLMMGYDAEFYLHPDSILNCQINSLSQELLSDESYEPELIQGQLMMKKTGADRDSTCS